MENIQFVNDGHDPLFLAIGHEYITFFVMVNLTIKNLHISIEEYNMGIQKYIILID